VFDHVQFYASPDLKTWTYLSSFGTEWGGHGGTWECPDLFPLPVAGTDESKWVLLLNLNPGGPQGGSGTQYFVGDFDGERFTLDDSFAANLHEHPAVWLDWGRDNYAGVTWSDIPRADGRRIFIGWMSNWDYAQQVPTQPWRSAMTLPRTLQLHRTPAGLRVYSEPVAELAKLRAESVAVAGTRVAGTLDLGARAAFPIATSEVTLRFDVGDMSATEFGILLSNARGEQYRIGFDTTANAWYSDRRRAGAHDFSDKFADRIHRAPRQAGGDSLVMHLYFDVASVELFADGGATVMTDIYFPTEPFDRMTLYADGGSVILHDASIARIKSIW